MVPREILKDLHWLDDKDKPIWAYIVIDIAIMVTTIFLIISTYNLLAEAK